MGAESYERLMQQAMAASEAGEAEVAIRLWSQAGRCEPRAATPHLLLAAEFAQSGRIEEAEAAFANALLLSPNLQIARFQLGLLQFTSGRVGIALLTWQPIVEQDGGGPLSLFVRGFAALARDDFADAIETFEAGIERNLDNAPLNNDIRMVIARIRELVARNDAGKAAVVLTDTNASSTESSEHILLMNYQQYGLPH